MVRRDLLGTPLVISAKRGKAFNLDTICLADFIRIPKGTKTIVDFGTGNGAILLYLSLKFEGKLIGYEIQKERYELALKNIEENHLQESVYVFNQDIKGVRLSPPADIIVSNPPFFKVDDPQRLSLDPDMMIAKHEIHLDLENLVMSVQKNIKNQGLFFMIHKADRLEEIMETLNRYDFKVKRLRFIHPRVNQVANQVLIEARYKGKGETIILPPLIQYQDSSTYSDEMNEIYQGRSYRK